jgi:hypothetical protein
VNEMDGYRDQRVRDLETDLRKLRENMNDNNLLLAKHGLRLEALEKSETEREGLLKTLRNAILLALVGALLSATSIINGLKGWFSGVRPPTP